MSLFYYFKGTRIFALDTKSKILNILWVWRNFGPLVFLTLLQFTELKVNLWNTRERKQVSLILYVCWTTACTCVALYQIRGLQDATPHSFTHTHIHTLMLVSCLLATAAQRKTDRREAAILSIPWAPLTTTRCFANGNNSKVTERQIEGSNWQPPGFRMNPYLLLPRK